MSPPHVPDLASTSNFMAQTPYSLSVIALTLMNIMADALKYYDDTAHELM